MAGRFLYLMRHGEAAEDGELTARGEEQARLAGERLRSVPLTGILHSPRSRAAATAQIVASCGLGVSPAPSELLDDYIPSDPDLTELPASFGRLVSAYSPTERVAGARPPHRAAALDRVPARFAPAERMNYLDVIHRGRRCRLRVQSCLTAQAAWLAGPESAGRGPGKE